MYFCWRKEGIDGQQKQNWDRYNYKLTNEGRTELRCSVNNIRQVMNGSTNMSVWGNLIKIIHENRDSLTRCPLSYSAILSISSFIFSMFCRLFSSHSCPKKNNKKNMVTYYNLLLYTYWTVTLAFRLQTASQDLTPQELTAGNISLQLQLTPLQLPLPDLPWFLHRLLICCISHFDCLLFSSSSTFNHFF